MTVADPWGMPLSTSREVAEVWGAAMRTYHDRRSGDVDLLRQVVEADPGFAVARATAALWAALMASPFDGLGELAAAKAGRADHDWERSYVAAVADTLEHGRWPAMPRWLAHHDEHPGDLMGLMVCGFLLVMSADKAGYAEAERRARRSADVVGEDPMLVGYLAMAAQDRGDLAEAHRLATRSLELDPTGFAGGHPLAHVYFESGDHDDGLAWLDDWLTGTDQKAMFGRHLVWHSALHHLAVGDAEGALARYARCGGSDAGGRLIDGPSLLWRCQLLGHVPPGTDPERPRVSELAAGLMDGVPFTFLGVHAALALATAGDADGLRQFAHNARSFDAPGAAEILPVLASGLAAFVEGEHGKAVDTLAKVEDRLWDVGGSHAQREVFEDTLIHALIRAGRLAEAGTRLRRRLDRRGSALDTGLLAETAGADALG
jgi:hypothetical protein